MSNILIIDHFSQTPYESGNNRFTYLANMLCNKGHNVEIATSKFSHISKKIRKLDKEDLAHLDYKYTLLDEPVYRKNVSLRRFYSHYIFGKNLEKYLYRIKKPDLIYISVPSIDVGYVAAKYCKKNYVPFIVDIQDIWPEAFKLIFNIPVISDIVFLPTTYCANITYSAADKLIAVSDTFLKRGLRVNKKDKNGLCVYLGTDLSDFDNYTGQNTVEKPDYEFWVTYIGTLGHSYDINLISDALYILKEKGYENIVFKIIGDGPLINNFINYAKGLNIKADFLGRMDYAKMTGYLKASNIAVNPFKKGASQSIVNKHGDYAAAGLPVVNTQESLEYRSLLTNNECGINCECENAIDVANAIEKLYKSPDLAKKMGEKSRLLAEEKFDRVNTYIKIIDLIESTLRS